MNFIKKYLVKKGTKVEIGALKRVRALSLLILDLFTRPWALTSQSWFSMGSTKGLTQSLHQI